MCAIDGCGKAARKRGWCGAHYQRWWKRGDPNKQMKITNGEAGRYFREVVLAYDGNDCLPWPYGKTPDGYGKMRHEGRDQIVSRLVCEHVNGPPPTPKHDAAHSCGKGHKACVTKRHLSWKTHRENKADEISHGTRNHSERNGHAKLTKTAVQRIRALRGSVGQRSIAEQFGITQSAVSHIQRMQRWTHVEGSEL